MGVDTKSRFSSLELKMRENSLQLWQVLALSKGAGWAASECVGYK